MVVATALVHPFEAVAEGSVGARATAAAAAFSNEAPSADRKSKWVVAIAIAARVAAVEAVLVYGACVDVSEAVVEASWAAATKAAEPEDGAFSAAMAEEPVP